MSSTLAMASTEDSTHKIFIDIKQKHQQELLLQLRPMVYEVKMWREFGSLLEVPPSMLDKIENEHPMNVGRRVIEVCDYWVKNDDNASIGKAITALQKIPEEKYIADQSIHKFTEAMPLSSIQVLDIKENHQQVGCMLDIIQREFALLITMLCESLESKADVKKVEFYVCHYLHDTYSPQNVPENFNQLLVHLQPHYCFLYYEILKEIADVFVREPMKCRMEAYGKALDEWLESNTINDFKVAIINALDSVKADPSTGQCLVVVRLQPGWLNIKIKNLQKLLAHLFGKCIFNKIIIKDGSVLVQLVALEREMLSIITLASKKLEYFNCLGIISIQVRSICLPAFSPDEDCSFTLMQSLAKAIARRQLSSIRCLLEVGVNPNAEYHEKTPLMFATAFNNTEIMSLLVEYNADIHQFIADNSAIHTATFFGNVEAVEFLLKAGVSPDHHKSGNNFTPLMMAASLMKESIILLLIKNGADINLKDGTGFSALAKVCVEGKYSMAKLLLENGANPNLQTNRRQSILFLSCIQGYDKIAQLLLDFNADPNTPTSDGTTPLIMACHQKYYKIVKILLQVGVSVDVQADSSVNKMTALHIASNYNDTQMMTLLLNANANVNIQDIQGLTPLHLACSNENEEMVIHFLEAGADPNITEKSGMTSLHYACSRSNEGIVRLLLHDDNKTKTNVNVLTTTGHTPLAIAAVKGNTKIAEMLLAEGADVELEKDSQGWTPIFYAAAGGHLDIVNLLIKHGAEVKNDKSGATLQSIATELGKIDIESLLQEATAHKPTPMEETTTSEEPEKGDDTKVKKTDTTALTTSEVDVTKKETDIKQVPLINEDDPQSHYNKFTSFVVSTGESILKHFNNARKQLEHHLEAVNTLLQQVQLHA